MIAVRPKHSTEHYPTDEGLYALLQASAALGAGEYEWGVWFDSCYDAMAAWQIKHCKTLQPNNRNFKAAFFPSPDKINQDTEHAQRAAYILYKEAYDDDCTEEEFWRNHSSRTEDVVATATVVSKQAQFALSDTDRYYTMDSGAITAHCPFERTYC